METTKNGGRHGGKVPLELRFSPSSSRYSQFSVSDHEMPLGPKWAQIGSKDTIFGQEKWTKYSQKAHHTLSKWIMSMNRDTNPHWHLSQSHQAPFWGILGPFGGQASPSQNRHIRACRGAMRAGNAHSGAKDYPEDDYLGSQDPSRGLWNPDRTFRFFHNFP